MHKLIQTSPVLKKGKDKEFKSRKNLHPISSSGLVGYHFCEFLSKRGAIDKADVERVGVERVNAAAQYIMPKNARKRVAIFDIMVAVFCN